MSHSVGEQGAAVVVDWSRYRKLWRKTASLPRKDFILALVAASVLPANEAIQAARGEWPATFNPVLAGLTDQEALEAQVDWAAADTVDRSHLMIDALLEPEQADTIFGYDGR